MLRKLLCVLLCLIILAGTGSSVLAETTWASEDLPSDRLPVSIEIVPWDELPDGETLVWGDANGDEKVSSSDIVRLKKYFAALDPDTGESTVTLGPSA